MSIATLNKGNSNDTALDNDKEEDEQSKELAQIDGYITECRAIYQSKFVNERTRAEYEEMWASLRAERKLKEMSENSRYLYEMIAAAEGYEKNFRRELNNAVDQKWIGQLTRKNWIDRFNDPNVLEWDRKKWIKEEFPKYLKGWEDTAKVRKDVWKLAKDLNVSEKDVPELRGVLKVQDFLSLHFFDRKNKIYAAKAALLAYKKQERAFLSSVESKLKAAASSGHLHSSKIGKWMAHVMESDNPQGFAKDVLDEFLSNWAAVKSRYDNVMPKLKKEPNKMRGFKQITEKQFLLLDYDARIAYVEEAESRHEGDVNEDGPLAALRLDIRHAMDTGHWEEAELLLEEARSIDPDDKAVRSMGRYLETHRDDREEESDGQDAKVEKKQNGIEALMNLREIMNQLPANMRALTEKALNSSNPNTLKRLWQLFYNRKWVRDHGYADDQVEREAAESKWHKEQTAERIANGHEWEFEHNHIKGETSNDAGIRDECVKPQVLHTNRSGLSEIYEGVERNADNSKFGYWTTLVDGDVPYELLRDAVMNHMYHIKQNAKILRESGLSYSSTGIPFSNN